MRKFLQEYGKHILAVVSVLLMVAWAVPRGLKNFGGGANVVQGYMGKEKVYGIETHNAKADWEAIERARAPMRLPTGQQGVQPLGTAIVGPACTALFQAHPDAFVLLQKEAWQMGVRVNQGEVEDLMQRYIGNVEDENRADQFRRALGEVLLVRDGFLRAASVIKVSQPIRDRALATNEQSISVNAVAFDTSAYAARVPAPTAQQIDEQFNKYRDVVAGTTSESNPFGFGYKYPDRVKLQYVAVTRTDVRRAIEAKKDAHRWEVDSYIYYTKHQEQFPSTQKAATREAFSLTSTQPSATTRPFTEVKDEIKSFLIDVETTKLAQAILTDHINRWMGADYMTWRHAQPATNATTVAVATQPVTASSLGPAYPTFDYLKALAAKVQADTGVLPTVASLTDKFMSPDDITKIKGLGDARAGQETVATYLEASVASFLKPDSKTESSAILRRNQPSQMLVDALGNFYVLRISDADPSHPPASASEVAEQVRADWNKSQAYAIAKQEAQKLLLESKVGGLSAAAKAAKLQVITTNCFSNDPEGQVIGLPLDTDAKKLFLEGAFKLLTTAAAHPGGKLQRLVELPVAGKVVVTELGTVTPSYNEMTRSYFAQRAAAGAAVEEVSKFIRSWFDYNQIVSRLNYREVEVPKDKESQGPPPTEPPLF